MDISAINGLNGRWHVGKHLKTLNYRTQYNMELNEVEPVID